MSSVLTHTPAEIRLHCLDFGGRLALLRDLPRTRVVTGSYDPDCVEPVVEELESALLKREESSAQHDIGSLEEFRRRRR